jgi:hypothetical protein
MSLSLFYVPYRDEIANLVPGLGRPEALYEPSAGFLLRQ